MLGADPQKTRDKIFNHKDGASIKKFITSFEKYNCQCKEKSSIPDDEGFEKNRKQANPNAWSNIKKISNPIFMIEESEV